jgi:hypothetical protein
MSFVLEMPVRFAHIDAAGIVFYPRYFEMLNATVEEWFAMRTGCAFAELHLERRLGVPNRLGAARARFNIASPAAARRASRHRRCWCA